MHTLNILKKKQLFFSTLTENLKNQNLINKIKTINIYVSPSFKTNITHIYNTYKSKLLYFLFAQLLAQFPERGTLNSLKVTNEIKNNIIKVKKFFL